MDAQETLRKIRLLRRKCDAEADTLNIWRQQMDDAIDQCPPSDDPQLRTILFDVRRNLVLSHTFVTTARQYLDTAETYITNLTSAQEVQAYNATTEQLISVDQRPKRPACPDCPLISNPPCESSVPCCRCNEDCNSRQPCPKNPQKQ